MKISKNKLYCICLLFLMYNAIFMRFQYINNASSIRYFIVALLGIMAFPISLYSFNKLNRELILFGTLYSALVFISAFINRNIHVITHTTVSASVYICLLIESTIIIKYVIEKYGSAFLLDIIGKILLIYILANDILLLISPKLFFTANATYYLFGNKFAVAYRHLEYLSLIIYNLLISKKNAKKQYNIYIVMYISICFIIFNKLQGGSGGSGTGTVAIIIMLLLYLLPSRFIKNKYVYLLSAIGATVFTMVFETILSIPSVQNLIVNFLHKDLTLTGRIVIYKYIPNVLHNHLLFGYGHGSTYETWMRFTHIYPNSQNGYIDCIVEQGLLATIVLFLFVMLVIDVFKKNTRNDRSFYPILILIYTYSIVSCVEVTISIVFVWWALLLFLISTENLCNINDKSIQF